MRSFSEAIWLKVRLQRLHPLAFDGGFVHAAGVEVADFLDVGAGGRGVTALGDGGGAFFQDDVHGGLVAFVESVETAPARLVRRDGVVLEPGAVGEVVEIVARLDAAVEVGGIERRQRGRHHVVRRAGGQRAKRQTGGKDRKQFSHRVAMLSLPVPAGDGMISWRLALQQEIRFPGWQERTIPLCSAIRIFLAPKLTPDVVGEAGISRANACLKREPGNQKMIIFLPHG